MGWSDLCSRCVQLTRAELTPTDHEISDPSRAADYYLFTGDDGEHAATTRDTQILKVLTFHDYMISSKDIHLRPQELRPTIIWNLEELYQAARFECHTCLLLLNMLATKSYEVPLSVYDSLRKFQEVYGFGSLFVTILCKTPPFPGFESEGEYEYNLLLQQVNAPMDELVDVSIEQGPMSRTGTDIGRLEVTEVFDALLNYPTGRQVPATTLHAHTSDRIRAWIEQCQQGEHPACSTLFPDIGLDERPMRLIEIRPTGTDPYLRLVEAARLPLVARNRGYTALSHCWGDGGIACKLLASDDSRYQECIPWSSLPRTFRDAVNVTISLGYQYIWIDALCIIQDNGDDWAVEAPRMAAVYMNAAVCLAATAAINSTKGLFVQELCLTPCVLDADWLRGKSKVLLSLGYYGHRTMQVNDPLTQRAWTYQEAQLSFRTVRFARDQLWWSCPSCLFTELGPVAGPQWPLSLGLHRESILQEPAYTWDRVVNEYTRRKVTKKSDHLIALSGVAQIYARLHGLLHSDGESAWLAGLWRSQNFPRQLLWTVPWEPPEHCSEATNERTSQDPYVAPSWSWASVHCRVVCGQEGSIHGKKHEIYHSRLRVLSASVQTSGSDPYGPVVSGEMLLAAPMHDIKLITKNETGGVTLQRGDTLLICGRRFTEGDESIRPWRYRIDPRNPSTGEARIKIFLPISMTDTSADKSTNQQGTYFPNAPTDQTYARFPHIDLSCLRYETIKGLLLTQVPGLEGTYKRAGILEFKGFVESGSLITQIWASGTEDLAKERYLEKHEDGVYTIRLI